jgi:hypothetical protein
MGTCGYIDGYVWYKWVTPSYLLLSLSLLLHGAFRHWSLFDSMLHSNYVASKLTVWKSAGTIKLQARIIHLRHPPFYKHNVSLLFFNVLFLFLSTIYNRKCWLKWAFLCSNAGRCITSWHRLCGIAQPPSRILLHLFLITAYSLLPSHSSSRAHFRTQIVGPVAEEYGLKNPPVVFKVY